MKLIKNKVILDPAVVRELKRILDNEEYEIECYKEELCGNLFYGHNNHISYKHHFNASSNKVEIRTKNFKITIEEC